MTMPIEIDGADGLLYYFFPFFFGALKAGRRVATDDGGARTRVCGYGLVA